MITPKSGLSRLKWCALAIIPILILSLGPQIQFWLDRGSAWQGSYATLNADEFLYSAYLNALIDGQPRRNDPFNAIDDRGDTPLPESAFSIQMVPALFLSSIARMFGWSASTTFISLTALAGLAAALAVFWLLLSISGDYQLSASGTLLVLLTGTLCAGQGLIGVLLKLDIVALGLPFLRRYQPASSFYLFFVFCTLIWHALTASNTRRARLAAFFAGSCLGLLVFCYLYLWTAALAWFVCVVLLWLVLQPTELKRRGLETFAITAGPVGLALVPYAYLVSNRSHTLDELQTLISTRRFDLFRIPEIIGYCVLALLILGIVRGRINKTDPRAIFIGAFALIPFAVFNQQILSGKSMQPFHFETFIANYAVLVSLVILATFFKLSSHSHVLIAVLCIILGATEVQLTRAFSPTDLTRDEMVPAIRRLNELSPSATPEFVFSPHFELNRILPTWSRAGTCLGIGGIDFGSSTHQQRKDFLYAHFYYSGMTPAQVRELIAGKKDQLAFSYYVKYVIFGHERVRPTFSLDFQPVTQDEIEREIDAYDSFANSFSRLRAASRSLTYAVALNESAFDFSRIDKWYERDDGQVIGKYSLYRLKLRD